MTVKIDARVLGIARKIEVKETSRNIQRAMLVQKDLVNVEYQSALLADKGDEATFEEQSNIIDVNFQLLDTINEFVIKALRLNDKQAEKLVEDTETDEAMALAMEIISGLLHIEPATDETVVADKSLTA